MPDGAWSEPRSLVTDCCGRGHLVAHKTLPGFLPPYSTFLFLTRLQQWPLRAVPSLAPSPTSLALSSAPPSLPGPDGPSSQQLPLFRGAATAASSGLLSILRSRTSLRLRVRPSDRTSVLGSPSLRSAVGSFRMETWNFTWNKN